VAADTQTPIEDVTKELLSGQDPGEGDGVPCDDGKPPFGTIGGRRERVDRRYLEWKLDAADSGEVDRQAKKVGTVR
jgi:hypothetical protein